MYGNSIPITQGKECRPYRQPVKPRDISRLKDWLVQLEVAPSMSMQLHRVIRTERQKKGLLRKYGTRKLIFHQRQVFLGQKKKGGIQLVFQSIFKERGEEQKPTASLLILAPTIQNQHQNSDVITSVHQCYCYYRCKYIYLYSKALVLHWTFQRIFF